MDSRSRASKAKACSRVTWEAGVKRVTTTPVPKAASTAGMLGLPQNAIQASFMMMATEVEEAAISVATAPCQL